MSIVENMDWAEAIKQLASAETDVYSYSGPITYQGYIDACDELSYKRGDKAILFLCTFGGDPNAAYRIARAMMHNYGAEKFSIAIPSHCKSAGTLICIGASELIFFDQGELGPLDTQIIKQDELFQRSSGLDIIRGMTYLNDSALDSFKSYLYDISQTGGISTKVASDIAANIVKGLYTPIYGQIDPIKLGEMNAALQIAHEYGSRLNEKSNSLKKDALKKLIHEYPAHGFVIDRAEARTLFGNVTAPTPQQKIIGQTIYDKLWKNQKNYPIVCNLTNFILKDEQNDNATQPNQPAEQSKSSEDKITDNGLQPTSKE